MEKVNELQPKIEDLENKIYLDKDGNKYKLADLTLDEEEEVNKLILSTGNTMEISNENSKKFLSLVLEPVYGEAKAIGRVPSRIAVEVLKDFLSWRALLGSSVIPHLKKLTALSMN